MPLRSVCASVVFTVACLSACPSISLSACLSVRAAVSAGGEINLMISYCGWCSLTAGESSGHTVGLLREQRHAQIISPAAFIHCCAYCCIITPSSLPYASTSSHFPPSLSTLTVLSLVLYSRLFLLSFLQKFLPFSSIYITTPFYSLSRLFWTAAVVSQSDLSDEICNAYIKAFH